ncbi:MAG TPA: hypothetical protein VFV46_05175 [Lacibacter sp.]|nr:hypothetical protein [Lacibacter sp.]
MRPGKTTAAFFVLAVIFRTFYIFLYPPAGNDHEMIHAAVDNLLSGNGLSFPVANTNDLSSTAYQPMTEWPPLVAYFLSVVKAIVGNADAADILIMSLGMCLLLLVMHNIMKLLNLTDQTRIILWIIIAANPDPFRNLGISDLYSALFMMWGVLFLLRFLQQPQIHTGQLMAASVFFFLPAAFRYQYYPLIFLFPLLILGAGHIKQNPHLFKKGLLSLSIVFFLLCYQVATLYQHSGSASYIADDETGFYPQNLLLAYPFLLKAFLNTSYFETKLLLMGQQNMVPYYAACALITFSILTGIFIFLFKQVKGFNAHSEEPAEILKLSRLAVYMIAAGVVLLLSALSLRYYPQVKETGGMFTYVKEGRYFIVSSLLFLMLFASLSQNYILKFKRSWQFPVRKLAFASLMIINLSLFGKFLYNASTSNLVDYKGRRSENRQLVQHEIESLLNKYKLPVVAASEDKDLIYYPNIKDYGIVKNFKELLQKGIHTTQPVQVVLVTRKKLSKRETAFVQQRGAKEVFSNKHYRLFHFIADNKQAVAMLY